MKRIIFILSVSTWLFACSGSDKPKADEKNGGVSDAQIENPATAENPVAQNINFAEITFKDTFHDFGDILEGQKVEFVYEFKNTGKHELLITNCQAQCGCTVPNWPKQPVQPGESGKIKVIFDSSGKGGVNNKNVTVYANIKEQTKLISFRANVRALAH